MYTILVASLNENMNLARKIRQTLEAMHLKSEIINVVDLNVTMYDTDKEAAHGIPSAVLTLSETMKKATGYIIVAPEYNYSIPPVLTNIIAWLSRSGESFRELFALKYVQLATHSGSGGNDVCNAMRTQFSKLGAIVAPREIIATYDTPIEEESLGRILSQFVGISQR
ncbi:MAG: NADPH-dependent oxidoreductase [Epsilonproteobacteria bacterium]|uniref:NADPH-dependent FMN reductase n=1 Tax=Sulfurospirillum TaxID=57665 RepID=UPI000541BB27|nr:MULTISPECIES: NAD(P)H-dependent oxidoreductase [unclassified Sulfurospirillum]KHG33197.1 MAG: NADPH-dependent FMN reductase [Sulfurospirillum sp. MES]MCP3652949.1 NAD(P)H-dependent oxidoreductase [Sulfurospirillum sp. DNRA8]MCR1811801.1 NAD(P)H-dependent oxidoreductase [Sulfurospirillum sp. DNRA8]NCB53586.1 NADPH-dependent oxidoreductase [Campylobacterota bacterium]